MSIFVTYAGVDQGNASVRFGAIGLASAADSSPSFGSIIFDDPTGTRTITGWKTLNVDEPDCVGSSRLFTGYVADRRYSRGPYRTGPGRWIDTTIVDQNAVLGLRLITGADGLRPAETHIERIDWLLGSAYLSGLIVDDGLVYRGNPRPFGEADYRGQYAFDVLSDIAAPIFQTFFATYDQTTHRVGLFFNQPNATTNTSTLTISNVLTDLSSTCFAPLIDAEMVRDPSEVYSTVRMTHKYGSWVALRASTASAFISRGLQVNNDRIGSASAEIMSESLLDRSADEADTITCTVRLPASKVGLIDAGMRVGIRFTHLPGYETLTYSRVTRRNYQQTEGDPSLYDVQLELSTHGLAPSSGGSGGFPYSPSPPNIVQFKHADTGGSPGVITLDVPPSEGNVLVSFVTRRGGIPDSPSTGPAWTQHPHGSIIPGSDAARMHYRTVGAGESATIIVTGANGGSCSVWEIAGTSTTPDTSSFDDVDTLVLPATVDAGTLSPTAGESAVMIAGIEVHCSDWSGNGSTWITDDANWPRDFAYEVLFNGDLHPIHWAAHRIVSTTSGTYSTTQTLTSDGPYNFGGWGGLALVFAGLASASPPIAGQWVYDEVPTPAPDGTTVTFSTMFDFADGSLIVHVDRLDQTSAVTSYDGTTGAFTLGFAPAVGMLVEVSYQGR